MPTTEPRYRSQLGAEVTNVIDGDLIQIREERHSADGVVVGVERAYDPHADAEIDFILADFGGEQPGRIPLREGRMPSRNHHHVKTV